MGFALINPFRLVKFFRLRSALERYRVKQGVAETLALSRLLVSLGDRRSALLYLKSGRRRFPASPELKALHASVSAEAAHEEIRALERSCRKSPHPEGLARLVELYRTVEDFDRCLAAAQDARKRFPDSWAIELATGKALFHRFLERRAPQDGKAAVEHLWRAQELRPESPRPLVYLASLLAEVGLHDEAAAAAQKLMQLVPRDLQSQRLLARLEGKRGGRTAGRADERTPAQRKPRATAEETDLLTALFEELKENADVCGAFLCNPAGQVVLKHHVENSLFACAGHEEGVAGLARSVQGASERLGIGRLNTCVMEGDPWWIYLAEVSGNTLAVFAGEGFKPDAFERVVNRYSQNVVAI